MNLTSESHANLDIESWATVLTYVNDLSDAVLWLATVRLENIASNGAYQLRVRIDDAMVPPDYVAIVPDGETNVVFFSRQMLLLAGAEVTIEVKGLAGDTAVDTQADLVDVSPIVVSDISGYGSVPVDHNFGGTDALAYKTPAGDGIDNASVQAFLLEDWENGHRIQTYVRGQTITLPSGRWKRPLMLAPGEYVIRFHKRESFGPDTQTINVTE